MVRDSMLDPSSALGRFAGRLTGYALLATAYLDAHAPPRFASYALSTASSRGDGPLQHLDGGATQRFATSAASLLSDDEAAASQWPFLQDTDRRKMEVFGGHILRSHGRFYWYGEAAKVLSAPGFPVGVNEGWTNEGIACYVSDDMTRWRSAGIVFRNTSVSLPSSEPGPYVLERPKVLYNRATSKFVMWFHLDSFSYTYRYAGVATSDSPLGPFAFLHALRPGGLHSFDLQLHRSPTSDAAFLVRDTNGHEETVVSALNPSYTDVTRRVSAIPGPCEAPALFEDEDGATYCLCSYATWYLPNPLQIWRHRGRLDAAGGWEELGTVPGGEAPLHALLAPLLRPLDSAATTYNSQPSSVVPWVDEAGRFTPILLGDSWNARGPGGVGNASQTFLRLARTGDRSRPWRLLPGRGWMREQMEQRANLSRWLY